MYERERERGKERRGEERDRQREREKEREGLVSESIEEKTSVALFIHTTYIC
jgi:hypothetical protein